MNQIDTNTLIAICTCAIGLTQFLFWRYIARLKAYESEKGKNLATKEDIAGITKEIEIVKESYNKSLENHKIELQKEFETHKYISNLCQSLDNQLLSHISKCLNANASKSIIYPDNDNNLLQTNVGLSRFLNTYSSRYKRNKLLMELINASLNIDTKYELQEIDRQMYGDESYYSIPQKDKENLIELLNKSLMLFLPPFGKDLN